MLVPMESQSSAAAPSSRDEIQAGHRTVGRKPKGGRAMTGAERQALYRARLAGKMDTDSVPTPPPEEPAARPARPRRWNAACKELKSLVAEYETWYEAMPEQLRATPTGEALLAIIELDLDEIASIYLPKGFGRD